MSACAIRRRRLAWCAGSFVVVCSLWFDLGLVPATSVLTASTPTVIWSPDSLKPTDAWNTLTLEMTVKRRRVGSTGAAIGASAPDTRYRIERSSVSGSWKTAVTVLSVDRAPWYSFAGVTTPRPPVPVARLEDDEDGTPVRAYDIQGRLLTSLNAPATDPLAATKLPRSIGTEWLSSFVATNSAKNARQLDLERRFGKGVKVGTLSRYYRRDLYVAQEVMVDARTVVPVESNHTRNDVRVLHRTFTYSPAGDNALVRTTVTSDVLLVPDAGEHGIVETAFSNIRLEQRR